MAAFEVDLEQNLWALHEELRDKAYEPGLYRHFVIQRPKVRRISAAPFRDRVVHHALMQVTWPIFEARMIHDSFACTPGSLGSTTACTWAMYCWASSANGFAGEVTDSVCIIP